MEHYIDSPIRQVMGAGPQYKEIYRRTICNYTRPSDDVSNGFKVRLKWTMSKAWTKTTPARRGPRGTLVPLFFTVNHIHDLLYLLSPSDSPVMSPHLPHISTHLFLLYYSSLTPAGMVSLLLFHHHDIPLSPLIYSS